MFNFPLLPLPLSDLRASPVHLLAVTTSAGWRPGIASPKFLGWVTVFAYFAAAVPCFLTFRHELAFQRDPLTARSAPFLRPHLWLGLSILLVLLGFNKQLDLQSAVTSIGRGIARSGGWYEHRRTLQALFILVFFLATLAAAGAIAWYLRTSLRRYLPALLGTLFLPAFIVIRAASFHHVDVALREAAPAGIRLNNLLELSGIASIAGAAIYILTRARPQSFRWPPMDLAKLKRRLRG